MRVFNSCSRVGAILLAASAASLAQAQVSPPAAPEVTVGADIKRLVFDWDRIPGATRYQLLQRSFSNPFTVVRDDIPANRTRVGLPLALHQVHWDSLRFAVAACNEAGCTNSVELAVRPQLLDAIGYFKASNTEAGDFYGREVALSSDGRTLAVTAAHESSNASGVNGDQANNSSPFSGAVYVYRRNGTQWQQEAYLKAGVNHPEQFFGTGFPLENRAMAISRDGSLLAVGAPQQLVNGQQYAGAVYLYGRSAEGSWSLLTTLNAPVVQRREFFGISVDMTLNGNMLKVSALAPLDGEGNAEGRTHIFRRNTAGAWRHVETLAPFYAGDFCATVRLSGDGKTLVSYCNSPQTSQTRVVTLKREANAWVHMPDINVTEFVLPQPLPLSADGNALVVRQFPVGILGGAFIYRWFGSQWGREINFGASSNDPAGGVTYAESMAFNNDGTVLAIGYPGSAFAGAGQHQYDGFSDTFDGSVSILLREESNPERWGEIAIMKAPNPGDGDFFGDSVALSGDGKTLAVGAREEDSAATGVDGDQTDNNAENAGAVYLY